MACPALITLRIRGLIDLINVATWHCGMFSNSLSIHDEDQRWCLHYDEYRPATQVHSKIVQKELSQGIRGPSKCVELLLIKHIGGFILESWILSEKGFHLILKNTTIHCSVDSVLK